MAERNLTLEINDLWLSGWVVFPAKANLTLSIGFKEQSERIRFAGVDSIEDIRSLHYALGRLIEQAEELCS